jgi:hypothetical protein
MGLGAARLFLGLLVLIMRLATPRDTHHPAGALLEGTEVIAQDMAEGLELLRRQLGHLLQHTIHVTFSEHGGVVSEPG